MHAPWERTRQGRRAPWERTRQGRKAHPPRHARAMRSAPFPRLLANPLFLHAPVSPCLLTLLLRTHFKHVLDLAAVRDRRFPCRRRHSLQLNGRIEGWCRGRMQADSSRIAGRFDRGIQSKCRGASRSSRFQQISIKSSIKTSLFAVDESTAVDARVNDRRSALVKVASLSVLSFSFSFSSFTFSFSFSLSFSSSFSFSFSFSACSLPLFDPCFLSRAYTQGSRPHCQQAPRACPPRKGKMEKDGAWAWGSGVWRVCTARSWRVPAVRPWMRTREIAALRRASSRGWDGWRMEDGGWRMGWERVRGGAPGLHPAVASVCRPSRPPSAVLIRPRARVLTPTRPPALRAS